MRPLLMCVLLVSVLNVRAVAGVIVYNSQSAFEAIAPGLTLQDFSSARVADNVGAFLTGPLTSATNNTVFLPGDIAAGLTISSTGSTVPGNQIYVAGVGAVGNTVKGIYTNASNATMSLGFAPGVSALGLKLIGFTNNVGARQFDVTIIGSLSTTNLRTGFIPDSGAGQFLGFLGTGGEKIQSISFQSGGGANEGVTFISFGEPMSVNAVPEPSGLVVALMASLCGVLFRRGIRNSPRRFIRTFVPLSV